MITNMKFGECLKLLLSALDISINRLSKAINVDSSLVNRWVNEKRIPAYNTAYIERITEYLLNNIQNSYQIQRLNGVLSNKCEDIKSEKDLKQRIKEVLMESQGFSFECKKNEQKLMSRTKKEQSLKLLNSNNFNSRIQDAPYTENLNPVSLSCEDKIVFGLDNILNISKYLFENAASARKQTPNKTIYITYCNDADRKNIPYHYLVSWKKSLLKAINNGWNVVFLIALNGDTKRIINFMNFVKPLLKTGRLNIYYLKKYCYPAFTSELIVIPETGVLSCFSANINSDMDCAFYFRNSFAINILKNNIEKLLVSSSSPLLKYFSASNSNDYGYCMMENEEKIGSRYIYKYCFSVLTLPEELFMKLLKKKNLSKAETLAELEFYRQRLSSFLSNLNTYEYKDIYLLDSINELIKHRQFYLYGTSGICVINLEVQEIIEHLENIVRLLKNYNNYYIAFTSHKLLKNNNFYCLVKERQIVLIETFDPSKNMPGVRLAIEEPMLIDAFDQYFNEAWEHIAPVNKDKNSIISWMNKHIMLLKKQLM